MYRLCVNTKLFYIKDLSIHKLPMSFFKAVRKTVGRGVSISIHPLETSRGSQLIPLPWYANIMKAESRIYLYILKLTIE